MWKSREEIDWKVERFRLLSDTVDKSCLADTDCKPEKQEEVAMHRKSLIVARRRCWSRCSRWELIKRGLNSRLCAKCSLEESRPLLRRCHEKKNEQQTVKMNKSKEEPVSSWCYQRQAGSMKALLRVV